LRSGLQHPVQIGADVGGVLDADREPEHAVAGERAVAALGLRRQAFMERVERLTGRGFKAAKRGSRPKA